MAATEVAQRNQEDAVKRFEAAEIALSSAVSAYQSSLAPEVTTPVVEDTGAQCDTVGAPSNAEDSAEQISNGEEVSEATGFVEPPVPTEAGVSGDVLSEKPAEEIVNHSPNVENGVENQEASQ